MHHIFLVIIKINEHFETYTFFKFFFLIWNCHFNFQIWISWCFFFKSIFFISKILFVLQNKTFESNFKFFRKFKKNIFPVPLFCNSWHDLAFYIIKVTTVLNFWKNLILKLEHFSSKKNCLSLLFSLIFLL